MGISLDRMVNTAKKSTLVLTIFAALAAQASSAACSGIYGCRPDPSDPYQEICKRKDCVEWGEKEVEVEESCKLNDRDNSGQCPFGSGVKYTTTEKYCKRHEESTITRALSKPHTSKERICVGYDSSGDCIRYKTINVQNRN